MTPTSSRKTNEPVGLGHPPLQIMCGEVIHEITVGDGRPRHPVKQTNRSDEGIRPYKFWAERQFVK